MKEFFIGSLVIRGKERNVVLHGEIHIVDGRVSAALLIGMDLLGPAKAVLELDSIGGILRVGNAEGILKCSATPPCCLKIPPRKS